MRREGNAKYEDITDQQIKHLELIQGVIGRLANNEFLVKGWSITVAGVLLGLAVNSHRWELTAISTLPTVAFWALDAYFLRAERLFRELYKRVAEGDPCVRPFWMGATDESFVEKVDDARVTSYWQTLWREVLSLFYGVILIATLVALVVLASNPAN